MVGSTIGQLLLKNKLGTKTIIIETIPILKFRLIIEKFISTLVPFNILNIFLYEQIHLFVLELYILEFEISILNRIYIYFEGGGEEEWGYLCNELSTVINDCSRA